MSPELFLKGLSHFMESLDQPSSNIHAKLISLIDRAEKLGIDIKNKTVNEVKNEISKRLKVERGK